MHHGNHPQGAFLRRIGNQVFAHPCEAQRPRGEVGASVPLMRERHQCPDGVEEFLPDTSRGERIIRSYEFPNVGDVSRREGMKIEALTRAHRCECFFSNSSSR